MYIDAALQSKGFLGEAVANGSVVVIKTHELHTSAQSKFEKAVVLLRNPYDAIMAFFNYAHAGHTGHAANQLLPNNSGKCKSQLPKGGPAISSESDSRNAVLSFLIIGITYP